MNKRCFQKLLVAFAFLTLVCVCLEEYHKTPHVVINEVCSSNFAALQDHNGKYSDCIELYNPGREDVSMNGCFLTDDAKEPEKYSLDGLLIPAGGYTLVWLDQTAPFRLSREGDRLFLIDGEQETFLDQIIIPRLSYDTSYGRTKDGGPEWSVMRTSLGRANQKDALLPTRSLDAPVFGADGGFYAEDFDLYLYSPHGEKIYYTLDGSEPCADSLLYEGPIPITDRTAEANCLVNRGDLAPTRDYAPDFPVDKAVVVRAVCYNKAARQSSDIVTETFFIGYDARPEYDGLAVLSLVADPDDLFDSHHGIYGNGASYEEYLKNGGMQDGKPVDSYTGADGEIRHRYMASNAFHEGRAWERPASVSYFDETHRRLFTQNVGIRISGNSTRSARQKSFNLFARNIYDDEEVIPCAFFGNDMPLSSVKLRNGGGNTDGVKFLDAFLEEAVRERQVSTQASKPCVVFLNGEYWGIYNLRERYDTAYLSSHYDLAEENIMLVKAGNAVTLPEETMAAYQYMLDVVTECDLVYEDTYALACGLVDIQSLIDHCCINLYLDNRDVAFGYNTALWRTTQENTPYGDGKWRFMLYDLDECIHPDSNLWENRENWMAEHPLLTEPAVQSLLDNDAFRRQFCLSFMDIANTTLSYERMHDMLAEWSGLYEEQIVKDHRCFCDSAYTIEEFHEETAQIDAFFANRFSFAMESLAKTFGLTGTLTRIGIRSNMPEGGSVSINTARLRDCGAWEGYYYSDFPVTVSAHANSGYRFVGWQGDLSDTAETITLSLEGSEVSLQAVFEKDDTRQNK